MATPDYSIGNLRLGIGPNRPRIMDGLQLATDGHEEAQLNELDQKPESAVSDATFGQWLTHHLSRLYDPVMNEPLPADLIRAIENKLK